MFWRSASKTPRSPEQRREHYLIERALADRLRGADRTERQGLYSSVYDELFQKVPHHPQLTRGADDRAKSRDIARQMAILSRYLRPGIAYLELGPGDCSVALEVAKVARRVYAVEVSAEITRGLVTPPNFELLITDGSEVPVSPGSIDLIYSNQLMEHLHPDDAVLQLANVVRALRPGAKYVCITPNALSGPHDISKIYDDQPTGFHLKEYSVSEMVAVFRAVGFTGFRVVIGARAVYLPFSIPAGPIRVLESLLSSLRGPLRRRIARSSLSRLLLGINFVATK